MKSLNLIIASLLSLGMVACGETESQSAEAPKKEMAGHDMSKNDDADHDMSSHEMDSSVNTAMANGKIVQIFADAGRVKIDHEAIEAIKMDAMTMSFQTVGEVDLTRFAEGDAVHFMLKKGRDGSFRIMGMCKADGSDAECMKAMHP